MPAKVGRTARNLVINADDLGMVASVNRGIIEAITDGVVTSASLMVNMPGLEDAIARLGQLTAMRRQISVGLHFNVVAGRPLSDCPSLQQSHGAFRPLVSIAARAIAGLVHREDVERELDAQLELASAWLRPLGIAISHIDSHRHAHCLPVVYDVVTAAAKRHDIAHVRHPYETGPTKGLRGVAGSWVLRALLGRRQAYDDVAFAGFGAMGSATFADEIARFVGRLRPGTTELMVHPGYDSPELAAVDPYRTGRERELRALVSPAIRDRLHTVGVRLTRFGAYH